MAKGHQSAVALFDISSSSIGGAHGLVTKNHNKVSILASTRSFSEFKEELTIERFVEQSIQKLSQAITLLKKADVHQPSHIQVLLASPWFVSQTRTITYSKTTPFTCSEKLIHSLIDKEIAHIIENDMNRFGAMGKDGTIIEKQITAIKLNGYSTGKPFGKKAKTLEIALVVTVAPKQIIQRFTDELRKGYSTKKIHFTTSPYATFVVARDFLGAHEELLVLDIGEEVTDIAFIKDDTFLYQHSFPVGTYAFYRSLVHAGLANSSEAKAVLEIFRQGKLSAAATSNTQKALESFGEIWQKSFRESIANTQGLKPPTHSYVICDQRFNIFFADLIKNDDYMNHIGGATNTVILFNEELLSPFVSNLDQNTFDETLIVGLLFLARSV